MFRRNGVEEYIVWRVQDREVDWFHLVAGDYQRLEPTADGVYQSKVFPGLWLDAGALIAGDFVRAHEVLQKGIASPEHQSFVEQLRAAAQ